MQIPEIIELAHQYQLQLPKAEVPELPQGTAIAGWIDHTLLKAEALPEQVLQLCQEARDHRFASVCINPVYIPLAVKALQGSDVPVCTVIGFPLGATSTHAKVCEARWSLEEGAQELDMVLPVGLLKAGQFSAVYDDILAVTEAGHHRGALVKVIFENAYLNEYEKIMACLLCKEAGADFVKTSTGFGPSGATVEDVHLMRSVVGAADKMGVKAAGGIRTYADAVAMIKAGANRIGASAGVKILVEAQTNES